ncbi:MAG: hypothetical protein ACX932_04380 [Gammaproteobacteria bacterium]
MNNEHIAISIKEIKKEIKEFEETAGIIEKEIDMVQNNVQKSLKMLEDLSFQKLEAEVIEENMKIKIKTLQQKNTYFESNTKKKERENNLAQCQKKRDNSNKFIKKIPEFNNKVQQLLTNDKKNLTQLNNDLKVINNELKEKYSVLKELREKQESIRKENEIKEILKKEEKLIQKFKEEKNKNILTKMAEKISHNSEKKSNILNEINTAIEIENIEDENPELFKKVEKELLEDKEKNSFEKTKKTKNESKKNNKNKVSPKIPAQNTHKKAEVSPSLLERLKKTITGLLNAVSDFVTNIFKSDTDAEARRPLLKKDDDDDNKKVKKDNDITNESTKDIFNATKMKNENQEKSPPSNGEESTVWSNFFPQSTGESDVQQKMPVNANKSTSPKIGQK